MPEQTSKYMAVSLLKCFVSTFSTLFRPVFHCKLVSYCLAFSSESFVPAPCFLSIFTSNLVPSVLFPHLIPLHYHCIYSSNIFLYFLPLFDQQLSPVKKTFKKLSSPILFIFGFNFVLGVHFRPRCSFLFSVFIFVLGVHFCWLIFDICTLPDSEGPHRVIKHIMQGNNKYCHLVKLAQFKLQKTCKFFVSKQKYFMKTCMQMPKEDITLQNSKGGIIVL